MKFLHNRVSLNQYLNATKSENIALVKTINQRYDSMLDEVVGMDYPMAKELLQDLGWTVMVYNPSDVFGGGAPPVNVIQLIVFDDKVVPYNLENIKRSQDESNTEN